MSRRGGGRRPDSAQPPSFHRGGGRGRGGVEGRGRGGGGGGGGGSSFPPHSTAPPPRQQPSSSRGRVGGGGGSSFPPLSTAPTPRQQPSSSVASSSGASSVAEKMSDLSLSTPPPPSSSKSINLPTRPGYGTVGTKCIVKANHFLVKVAEKDLYHYDVSISPEISSKQLNREVIKQLEDRFKESHMGNRLLAYDGKKSLYTAGALPFESKDFSFKLTDDSKRGQSSSTKKKDKTFNVTIKFAGKPDIHHLTQFLSARQRDAPLETIQALDVVLRAKPSEMYTVVGRSFFSEKLGEKGELGDGLEYWRGYYQSLRPTQMGLSFNIDVSARGFYEPILVTDFVANYFGLRDLSRPLSDQNRVKVKKALKGIKVEFTHMGCTRSYKITGVSDQPLNRLIFTLDDKTTQITVVQYFREKYNIALRYTSLPALQAKSNTSPIFLPMEVYKISAGQRYTKKLNEKQVTALLRATCQRPRDREYEIKKMVQRNDFTHNKLVNDEFGISVAEELAVVKARVLPPPMLKYHDTGREATVDPRFGQWNMINKKMVDGGSVDFWTCVNFSHRVQPDLPVEFCRQLVEMCRSKGMQFSQNPILPIHSAHPNMIENTLKDIHNRCNQQGKKLKLLIIILPDVSGSYGIIKRVCETELGIVSQCCQPRQASKLSKQYMENVALKINVKVGGRNTILNDAFLRRIHFVSDVPTIIFGADVTHPQAGEDTSPSIAAVVASMDWPDVTKYRGLVSAQRHREEIIEDLYKSTQDPEKGIVHGGMIRELFIAFRNATRGLKPARIIFYRDGVSEGQFSQVLLHEIEAIRKACSSLQEGYQPRITFIVVQKRHHTRLFPADYNRRDQMDRSGNILPGTVVDTEICHPMEFDFYLNSHAGIQGTSRPSHYHVLFDENNFDANSLQTLTNNLCYTYARCTRSVSIVPPAYYAHLAAFRARYYIEGDHSDAGSSSGGSSRERVVEVRSLPTIKENVKDVMFYC